MAIPLANAFRDHGMTSKAANAADPAVFETAVAIVAFALSQPPLDVGDFFNTVALKEAETLKRRFQSRLAQQGGHARKADALTLLIEKLVLTRPEISLAELMEELNKLWQRRVIVVDIAENEISYLNQGDRTKTIAISGLKDRLSRARKNRASRLARF
jgi:hypothetical protein